MIGGRFIALHTSLVALFGPPPPELSPPPDDPAPIEGPARAPEASDDDVPGIEFAPTLASDDDAADTSEAPSPLSEPSWPDPGTAPGDGAGAFVAAGALIPIGILVPIGLSLDPSLSRTDINGIIVAGVGMEVIAMGVLGLGIARRVKLRRWALAYRVQPTPQGGGLLAAGGLAGTAGLTMLPLGIWVLARGGSQPVGISLAIAGALSLGVITPPAIVFGKRRHDHYQRTGGWMRRPLPEVRPEVSWVPGVMVLPDGLGLSVGGRF